MLATAVGREVGHALVGVAQRVGDPHGFAVRVARLRAAPGVVGGRVGVDGDVQRVAAGAAVDLGAVLAVHDDRVVAVTGRDDVRARVREDPVVARAAVELVDARAAVQNVVTVAAEELVVVVVAV